MENPGYMKDKFELRVKSKVVEGDRGQQDNVFGLSKKELARREVVNIDFPTHEVEDPDKNASWLQPTNFQSSKTGRGPLKAGWLDEADPVITVYKLVFCKFKKWPFETMATKMIMGVQERFIVLFHRRLFCWLDEYHDLNMKEIRVLEKEVQEELDRKRRESAFAGVENI